VRAIILAAGLGTRLEPITRDIPKCMVPVAGVPVIDRMIGRIAEAGIEHLVVVSGHLSDVLERHLRASDQPLARRSTLVFNEHYADWGNFYSLLVAREPVAGDSFVKFDGDVVLDGGVLPALLGAPGPGVLAIDRRQLLGDEQMKARVEGDRIVELNKRIAPARALGESIGIERIDAGLAPRVFDYLQRLIDRGETHDYYERAYELLMGDGVDFHAADITACTWHEIDTATDLAEAEELARDGRL
jgi:choline kinase